jgi:hypothetical protein
MGGTGAAAFTGAAALLGFEIRPSWENLSQNVCLLSHNVNCGNTADLT